MSTTPVSSLLWEQYGPKTMNRYHFTAVDQNDIAMSVTIEEEGYDEAVRRFEWNNPRARIVRIDATYR